MLAAMTPVVDAVYQEMLTRARTGPWGPSFEAWTERFIDFTGRFPAEHPQAALRREAAWEDALCRGGMADRVGRSLEDPAERQVAELIGRAQHSVFAFRHVSGVFLLDDLLSGASFLMLEDDTIAREVRGDNLGGLCEGRLLGTERGCVLLPGVVFHEAPATEPIHELLRDVHQWGLSADDVCDVLMSMDHQYRTLSRVKATYAYRRENVARWIERRGEGLRPARG